MWGSTDNSEIPPLVPISSPASTAKHNWARVRLWLSLAAVLASVTLSLRWLKAAPDETPVAEDSFSPTVGGSRWLGSASCASVACHGDDGPPGAKGCEFSTWADFDPHSRASRVLYSQRSQDMVRALGKTMDAANCDECLCCHGPFHFGSKNPANDVAFDAVGCEACHGPAKDWIEPHKTGPWRRKEVTAEAKAKLGFVDLSDPIVRTQACLDCHVGRGDRQVNHDLIAAGHPRLNFEALAFTIIPPSSAASGGDSGSKARGQWHYAWKQSAAPYSRIEQARTWAIGQVLSAAAALDLLADRLDASRNSSIGVWPELAEFDCFACHHHLRPNGPSIEQIQAVKPSSTQFSNQTAGTRRWSDWYGANLAAIGAASGLPPDALVEWTSIRDQITGPRMDHAESAAKARALAAALRDQWLPRIREESTNPRWTRQVLQSLVRSVRPRASQLSWDEAVQVRTALLVLCHAGLSDDPRQVPFEELLFAAGFDSPAAFDQTALAKWIEDIDNHFLPK